MESKRVERASRADASGVAGLAEVVLNVRDMTRARDFYEGLLGLEVISPPDLPGPVFLRAGRAMDELPAMVVLVQLPADAPGFAAPRTLHHLALAVRAEAFDGVVAAIRGAGLEIRTGQHPVLAARTVYVDDPDGNEVELIAPLG
jgi:catechol 2,3-dioxygenase-like lactoylglutathione lyase family enzyme